MSENESQNAEATGGPERFAYLGHNMGLLVDGRWPVNASD